MNIKSLNAEENYITQEINSYALHLLVVAERKTKEKIKVKQIKNQRRIEVEVEDRITENKASERVEYIVNKKDTK